MIDFCSEHNKKGYTALEILVVVAVMIMLAAIFIPTFKTVRNRSKQALCANNLRQLGMAISMYVQDDKLERFPGFNVTFLDIRELPGVLYPYLGEKNQNVYWSGELEIFRCPSNQNTSNMALRTDASGNIIDYKYNPNLFNKPTSQVVDNPMWTTVLYDYLPEDSIHSGGTNFLFADGHVKWMPKGELNSTHAGGTGYENWGLK